jgi:hypothetical protein
MGRDPPIHPGNVGPRLPGTLSTRQELGGS